MESAWVWTFNKAAGQEPQAESREAFGLSAIHRRFQASLGCDLHTDARQSGAEAHEVQTLARGKDARLEVAKRVEWVRLATLHARRSTY